MLAALTTRGLEAPMTIAAPTDGDIFLAYLEEVLCPQLRPGQVVVLDTLSAHKVAGVREQIEALDRRTQMSLMAVARARVKLEPGQWISNRLRQLRSKVLGRPVCRGSATPRVPQNYQCRLPPFKPQNVHVIQIDSSREPNWIATRQGCSTCRVLPGSAPDAKQPVLSGKAIVLTLWPFTRALSG